MRGRNFTLGPDQRRILYAASLLLLISGAAWAWIDHLDQSGRANDSLRKIKPWLMKTHGLSAMVFVLMLGTVLSGHVRRGWRAHKNRNNGAFFLTSVSVLTLSGYLLYYLGDERWREAMSRLHLWLGLAAPVLLVWHIRSGRRALTLKRPV